MLSRQYSALSSKDDKEDQQQICGSVESNDDLPDLLHCITCGKNFKSMKELVRHEDSKKHKENVAQIANQLNGVKLEEEKEEDEKEEDEKEEGEKDYKIKSEDGMNSTANPLFDEEIRCMHSCLSSVSLPDDATLQALGIVSGLDCECEIDTFEEPTVNTATEKRSSIVDSLLYLKIKELKNRRRSMPVRRDPNYSKFKNEEYYGEDTITENLIPNDSLILPKPQTKKPDWKASMERRRMRTSASEGHLQTTLAKSSLADSLRILKKRTATEGSKIKKKIFNRDSSEKESNTRNDS